MEPRIRFDTRTRKFKNEVTNRRGKKGLFLNLKKSCIINGLKHIPVHILSKDRYVEGWVTYV